MNTPIVHDLFISVFLCFPVDKLWSTSKCHLRRAHLLNWDCFSWPFLSHSLLKCSNLSDYECFTNILMWDEIVHDVKLKPKNVTDTCIQARWDLLLILLNTFRSLNLRASSSSSTSLPSFLTKLSRDSSFFLPNWQSFLPWSPDQTGKMRHAAFIKGPQRLLTHIKQQRERWGGRTQPPLDL